jgi:D-glycero-D-manno-heptose 1,7-bisphosphate phosphatase
MSNKAVFLDRDGTINKEVNYLSKIEQLEILPNSASAIKILNDNDFKVIVITNQSGVGRGYFSKEDLQDINEHLKNELSKDGAQIDAMYFCPHLPDSGCQCRKPRPGMIESAKSKLDLDLSSSFVVGDTINDLETGHNVGCKTALVLTGYGKRELARQESWNIQPDFIAQDLLDAVMWIIGEGVQ